MAGGRQNGLKPLKFEKDRMYFTRSAERKFFFVLTILMLAAGVMIKLGIL
jgi:hypothetical protein